MSALTEINWSCTDAKEPLRSYFEQAPVGLAECRYAGTIKSFNPALVRLLGARLDLRRPVALAELLSCELAMSMPDVPRPAAEKIRVIDNLARAMRLRLEIR